MNPLYSVLHATMGRPKKAVVSMRRWAQRAEHPLLVDYSMCVTAGDPTFPELAHGLKNAQQVSKFRRIHFSECMKAGSAPAWDCIAQTSTGDILVQSQDDLEPPDDWDTMLLETIVKAVGENWRKIPLFVAVSDGYRKDDLCCTAIMNRARMEQCGHFIPPEYLSVYSDDEVTYRALRDARDGKCVFVNARHLVFTHRHHYHDKTVPMDETYQWENSSHAYSFGHGLFHQRNPEAIRDGLRTWA